MNNSGKLKEDRILTPEENLTQNLISKALKIKDYAEIITTFKNRNLSVDKDFQKVFNRFYVVRRNETWRNFYYDFFQKNKNNKDITFKEIITTLYDLTGQIEHSFSSKLLSTINPNMPIWDVYVLKHLSLELSGKTKEEKIENRVQQYEKIVQWYEDYLTTDEAKTRIKYFDTVLPDYDWITPVKKIDFLIWGDRD